MKINILLLSTVIFSVTSGFSQESNHIHHEGCEHGLIAIYEDANTYIPPPADFVPGAERAVIISVNYSGFTPQAQTAFQFAVDIWASTLTSNVPILVNANFSNLGSGVLGSAGATNFYRNFPNAPLNNTYYPVALASSLRGLDLGVGIADISANFSSTANWYYGLDGNCPSGQFDFVSVVLHELCHGLGFVGSANVSGGLGSYGFNGSPVVYDVFVENNGGADITSFSNGSSALADQLTGGSLWWNGFFGGDANGGNRPRLFAPETWNSGSSYSHLNESTYPSGTINSLMTPFISAAEAIHDPGPIVYGMFKDMGWAIDNTNCAITDVSAGAQTPCNPSTGTYTQELIITYTEAPSSGDLVVNTQPFPITSSPQSVTLTGLVANGNQQNAIVSFTENGGCTNSFANIWTAPESCCNSLRITSFNPNTEQITLSNLGLCSLNTLDFIVSSEGLSSPFSGLSIVSGSNFLPPGNSVTYQWSAWNPNASGSVLALFLPNGNTNNPADLVDYVQWGNAGNTNEALAVSAGIWGLGDFVFDTPPYTFLGGVDDFGVEFWDQLPPSCAITNIVAGTQTPCTGESSTYVQELIIVYENEPSTGFLRVNNINFPITGSPQTVSLSVAANEQTVDFTAFFTAEANCSFTAEALVIALPACTGCAIENVQAGVQTPCFGGAFTYLQEIIVTYSNPPAGTINLNGIGYPITGSPQSITVFSVSDGLPVDVSVFFDFETDCSLNLPALFTAPLPCASCEITSLSAGTQSGCSSSDNTYTQEVIVSYSNAPGSGNLIVNSQSFPIGSSPQSVVLAGLISDELPVNVQASFSAEPACSLSTNSLFTAPAACNSCPGDFNGDGDITIADLLQLLSDFGCSGVCLSDLNGDSNVNVADLTTFLTLFGSSCE